MDHDCWGAVRGAWSPPTSRLEQPHKRERRHTFTQNLKAMSLWVILVIRCSTFTFLSDVRHITHTCTQQHSPFKRKLLLLVSSLLISPQTDRHYLYCRCYFLRKQTGCLGRTLRRTGLGYHCWVMRGAWGFAHVEAKTTTQARETPHSYPKP